jgi:ABC-type Fe3+/spermidine/putrescine transport system ATPase subunit
MSEQDDTAEIVEELRRIADELTGFQFIVVMRAAVRINELHDRLAVIEQANAERSAITERYYQQAVEETRDHGND